MRIHPQAHGGPVFPRPLVSVPETEDEEAVFDPGDPGISLRDLFAAIVLLTLTAPLRAQDLQLVRPADLIANTGALAYAFADAMLAARQKGGAS